MKDHELRRLSRSELLEILIAQTEESEQLKSRLQQAEAQLRDRQIAIDKAGTMAEAALLLNGVFDAAQDAAQQYLENVQHLSSQQEEVCRKAKEQAAKLVKDANHYSQQIHAKADAYWNQIAAKAAELENDHAALPETAPGCGKDGTA